MKQLLCLILLCASTASFSQEEPTPVEVKTQKPDYQVGQPEKIELNEKQPTFPGGEAAMNSFLLKNIRYPQVAMENGEQGTVYVLFIVEKDGSLTNIQIKKSVSPELDKEAKRLIQLMPHWIPGEMNGEKTRTHAVLPVKFVLM